jgi:hypothetical protein
MIYSVTGHGVLCRCVSDLPFSYVIPRSVMYSSGRSESLHLSVYVGSIQTKYMVQNKSSANIFFLPCRNSPSGPSIHDHTQTNHTR